MQGANSNIVGFVWKITIGFEEKQKYKKRVLLPEVRKDNDRIEHDTEVRR